MFARLGEEELLNVVDEGVTVVTEGDWAKGGRICRVFFGLGCEYAGYVFGAGVGDAA